MICCIQRFLITAGRNINTNMRRDLQFTRWELRQRRTKTKIMMMEEYNELECVKAASASSFLFSAVLGKSGDIKNKMAGSAQIVLK